MANVKENKKLLNRLRRLRGQIDALHRAVEENADYATVLQQATACRGALDGFMAKVVEDHIRRQLIDPETVKPEARRKAGEDLVELVHSFMR